MRGSHIRRSSLPSSEAKCASEWGAQCRTNLLGREHISEGRLIEPAFRPSDPVSLPNKLLTSAGPSILSVALEIESLIWTFSAGVLNRFDVLPRAALAGLIYSLPVFFAGMIFSTSLKRARDTSAALGANLCGAVFGGLLEYLSMLTGMKALTLLALALYLASRLLLLRRTGEKETVARHGDVIAPG